MKTKEFYGEKGEQMKVSFEWEKGENDSFSAAFSYEISRNYEYEKNNSSEDFRQRQEAFKILQEPTLFSNKICSLKAQKSQPPFAITNFIGG